MVIYHHRIYAECSAKLSSQNNKKNTKKYQMKNWRYQMINALDAVTLRAIRFATENKSD